MKKLGLALPNFGANQLAYLGLVNTNKLMDERYDIDVIGFYESLIKYSVTPNFACMQAVELWGYDGPTIACSLNMAEDLVKIPTVPQKYFYVWDLEWVHLPDKDYGKLKAVYSNPELTLITRHADYAKIIEKCWNRPVDYIVEDFDMKQLVNIVWNQN